MSQKRTLRWLDYAIFGGTIFLIFCLLFDSDIKLPNLVAWLGHWHPVVLHFPIVLLCISIFLGLTGKNIPRSLLTIATISALITAILGFFLGKEAGSKGDLLFWHQWLGGGVAVGSVIWYWLYNSNLGSKIYTKALQVILAGLIGFTGHYGGMVTHGEDFLALPVNKRNNEMPEDPLIYEDVVARILDESCVKCHNPNKKKGELQMTNISQLLKGGETGPAIIPGNHEKSELIQRVRLPASNEEHMPPEGEKDLTESEIQIIERWIVLNASDTLLLSHLDNNEPLLALVQEMQQPDVAQKWKTLPIIADSTIAAFSSDYVTIKRMANSVNALAINMYKPPEYSSDLITDLKPIVANIVQFDISGLPIGKLELGLVATCENLEWLEIDSTPITDLETDTLKVLSKLRTLKIYDTAIADKTLTAFRNTESLEQIYLWNTKVSEEALEAFRKAQPTVHINTGVDLETQTFFAKKDSIVKK
jgi:hypothetical protein